MKGTHTLRQAKRLVRERSIAATKNQDLPDLAFRLCSDGLYRRIETKRRRGLFGRIVTVIRNGADNTIVV